MKTAKSLQHKPAIELRTQLVQSDVAAIRTLVDATGVFSPAEVDIAAELAREARDNPTTCGYHFVVAESEGAVIGYACYGPIPCTVSSYDLYWIAVDPQRQRHGIGKQLMDDVEARIARQGGTRVYIDTSGRSAYDKTRRFYERVGYAVAANLPDFYAPGDAKVVYQKTL